MIKRALVALLLSLGGVTAGASLPLASARHLSFETDEGTWMALDVSPDGKQLAFISDRSGANNLGVANADGSSARQISQDDGAVTWKRHSGMRRSDLRSRLSRSNERSRFLLSLDPGRVVRRTARDSGRPKCHKRIRA